jgi:hypothetical protein
MMPVMCDGSSFGAGRRKPVTSVAIIVTRKTRVHTSGRRFLTSMLMTNMPARIATRLSSV